MKKQLVISDEVWAKEHAELMASENMRILKTLASGKTEKALKLLTDKFLSQFVELMLNKALNIDDIKNQTEDKQYVIVAERFMDLKATIQNEIANAFSNSLSKFTGKPVDYYVTVKPTPEPTSDLVN